MTKSRSYPSGVTSRVDVAHEDVAGASDFCGELFGWTFTDEPSPGGAAGILGTRTHAGATPVDTHLAVDDVAAAMARGDGAGGHAVTAPQAGMGAGRWPADAGRPEAAWSGEVFGWSVDDLGFGRMIRRPGRGDHLADTSAPEICERRAGVSAPPGFADAIGWMAPLPRGEEPHCHVTFTVADRGDGRSPRWRGAAYVRLRLDPRGARPRSPGRSVHRQPVRAPRLLRRNGHRP